MSAQTANSNEKGFTLIELMVAMLITLVGLMGLLQALTMSMQYNLQTNLRNEAVMIAQQVVHEAQGLSYNNIATTAPRVIVRKIRGGTIGFTVSTSMTQLQNSKQVDVGVKWSFKNAPASHLVSIIIGNS